MTPRLRAADRDRILRHAIGYLVALRAYGADRAYRELDANRDGLKGTDYDALRGGGSDESPTERAALADGLSPTQYDDALASLESVIARLAVGFTPTTEPPPSRTRPGRGKCRPGYCEDHWAAGIERRAATSRYTRWCRRCGDWRNTYGVSIPAPVLQAATATKRLTRSGNEDWQHWSVHRAWQTCGGRPEPKPDDTDEDVTIPPWRQGDATPTTPDPMTSGDDIPPAI